MLTSRKHSRHDNRHPNTSAVFPVNGQGHFNPLHGKFAAFANIDQNDFTRERTPKPPKVVAMTSKKYQLSGENMSKALNVSQSNPGMSLIESIPIAESKWP